MFALSPENQKKWAKVIAKAWSDPAFKAKLLKNPEAVLVEQGLTFPHLPRGTHIEMHENTPALIHLILPLKPNQALSEEEMRKVAGGDNGCAPSSDNCL